MKIHTSEFEQIIENNRLFNMRNISVPGISDNKWKEVIDQQDCDLLMFEIREDLISRVLDECYKKYIEKESIKYVVDCAHLAWKQIVDLNFYVHDRVTDFYGKDSLWIPDEELEPCVADSWAKGNISAKPRSLPKLPTHKVKTEISDYQIIQCSDYPTENKFDFQQEESKSDNLSEIYETDSYTKQNAETDRSNKFSVHFTSFVSNNDTSEDKIIEPVKEKTSDEFTKNLIAMRKKSVCITPVVENVKKKAQISWMNIDNNVEPPQPLQFPLLR